jgi:hypothetical protein
VRNDAPGCIAPHADFHLPETSPVDKSSAMD